MRGPSDDLRQRIGEQIRQLESEGQLTHVLDTINEELRMDLAEPPEKSSPEAVLDAVDGWAGLASSAVTALYAPASPLPLPGGLAGWGKGAVNKLNQVAGTLVSPLKYAAKGLGAASWTISVGFPWGVSVGLTWE